MQFITSITALLASVAAATNIVNFVSQDSVSRAIHFIADAGLEEIEETVVAGGSTVSVELPYGWIGTWHAVKEGEEDTGLGMLGEVAFNAWGDITFFDVSAIDVPEDQDNVKLLYPTNGEDPTSGCEVFPCDNAYYLPDDVQTKATNETTLTCTLGSSSSTEDKRDLVTEDSIFPNFKRDFVMGRYA